jgi:uncharacterized protein (DUF885 family)
MRPYRTARVQRVPAAQRLPRVRMLAAMAVVWTVVAACSTLATRPQSVDARLAAQNSLFDEVYQAYLMTHPELATSYGDYRYNDRLNDYSIAAVENVHASDERFLARLNAISTAGFAQQDALSHQVLLHLLQQRGENYRYREYEMPVSQMEGPHVHLADLPLAVPFDSVQHYEDYIARLHQIPGVFTQTEQVLRAGMKDHLMPVRFLLEKVPAQCQGVIAADPFLLPLSRFPADIPPQEQQRLSAAITQAVNDEVLPAYQAFARFIADEYAPHGRRMLAVTSLPGGEQRYLNDIRSRTTVANLSPDEIHRIGLREIERIQAQMLEIARKEGFADLASFRESLKTNPKYIPVSSQQILEDYRKYIGEMQPRLPELFGFIPGKPVTVEAIPDFQAAMATHYVIGTPDGARPGRVVVATSNFAHRTLILEIGRAHV